MNQTTDKKTGAAFVAILLVLLLNAVLSNHNTNQLVESDRIVAHTWEVQYRLTVVLNRLADAETGVRGFLLTGDERFLEPYHSTKQGLQSDLEELERLTADNRVQQQRAAELKRLADGRLAIITQMLAEYRQGAPQETTLSLVKAGKVAMDQARSTISVMNSVEQNLLRERRQRAIINEGRTRAAFYLATGVSAALLCIAFYLIQRILRERDRSNAEIRNMNAVLEQRVLDRTATLEKTNTQLQEANRELEAFSYSVSHDLRAPLRHISGFVELLQKKNSPTMDENGRRYVTTIAGAARHAGELVDDLLSFSRMGRTEMQQTQVSMESLVADVRHELQHETENRDIQWSMDALPIVTGDAAMLRLVWQNLLGNAVKYTRPQDKAVIAISCQREKDEWVFSVRDNGVGFDMAYIDKLWGVFQRLHPKEEFEGTGIGLANVRRIITRHRGKTWAVGEVNKGSTFFFSLPAQNMQEENGWSR